MESSIKRILIAALVIFALWSTGICSAASTRRNLTLTTLEDAEEDLPSLTEESEFKERYRRLIPYMTYYVSNNYVNPQSQSNYQTRIPTGSVQQLRRAQYSGRINGPKTPNQLGQYNYQQNLPHDKFIPSVQYDPKDMDNEEYFTPVRYNQRLNFENYQSLLFQKYQNQGSTSANGLRGTNQQLHFTTIRPTTSTINFPRKQQTGAKHTTNNFVQRPTQNPYNFNPILEPGYSFPEFFEPPRFTRPQIPQIFTTPLPVEKGIPQIRNPDTNLNHIVKSLQLTNQLPEVLNADNIDNSIKTLVEILSLLNNGVKEVVQPFRQTLVPAATIPSPKYQEFNNYKIVDSRPKPTVKPFQGLRTRPVLVQDEVQVTRKPQLNTGPYHVNIVNAGRNYLPTKVSLLEEPRVVENLQTVRVNDHKIGNELEGDIVGDKVAPQHLTTEEPLALNYPAPDGVLTHTQNFPPTSVKYGATRGKPNVDYPAYAVIPKTEFSCTTQRYKGFFGDPDTGCQVWHYCDLNGGKSSFLCPNGTIFSQVALTCDWWFNVKCESTAQLYVLNERLYKYILPVMPKFPEDFSGPEVDRYLEIKFKEMEKKMKEKKLKKQQEEVNKIKNSKLQANSADTE